ncbi:MFS transporter [Amycolatopsis saalfeldensis]|nr:MFS transporter [Amycolatopsis saalfeldensis]
MTARHADAHLWRLGGVLIMGAVLSILDATIVSVGIGSIAHDLGSSITTVQWVSSAYLLAASLTIPLSGWLTDRFGGKNVWVGAVALFTAGTLLCGFAWSAPALILFRVLHGLGGGLMQPVGQALFAQAAGPKLGRMIGMITLPATVAPVLGPLLGGVLVQGLGWRWLFFGIVPLGVATLVLALRLLPAADPLETREPARADPRDPAAPTRSAADAQTGPTVSAESAVRTGPAVELRPAGPAGRAMSVGPAVQLRPAGSEGRAMDVGPVVELRPAGSDGQAMDVGQAAQLTPAGSEGEAMSARPAVQARSAESTAVAVAARSTVPTASAKLGATQREVRRDPLDVRGLLLLPPGLAALGYGLGDGSGVFAIVGVVLLVAYGLHARTVRAPLLDLKLFSRKEFAVASASTFLLGASLYSSMLLLPLYYEQVEHTSALTAGLLLAPQALGSAVVLLAGGKLLVRFGPRTMMLAGIGLSLLGTIAFTQLGNGPNPLLLTMSLLVRGLGLGATTTPGMTMLYSSLDRSRIPRAASAINVVNRVGGSLGTALLVAVLHSEPDGAGSFGTTFTWTLGLSVLSLVPAVFFPKGARK